MKKYRQIRVPMFYKIILSFFGLIVILIGVLLASGIITQLGMQNYLEDRMEERYTLAVEKIATSIEHNGWELNDQELWELIRLESDDHNMQLELYDLEDTLVYFDDKSYMDDKNYKDETKTALDLVRRGPERGPDIRGFEPRFIEKELPIIVEDKTVGYIKVRFFDATAMNQDDIRFFNEIGDIFRRMLIAIVVVCLLISFFLARSITNPIKKVGKTAHAISEGDLKARATIQSRTKELMELSESINNLAESLEKEDALRKQVTSDMAHEIRTPLTALRSFFEAFIDGVYETNQDNMEKCYGEIIRISELVDRLKDISNIEEMNMTIHKEEFDLGEEIQTMCDLFKLEFDRKKIDLIYVQAKAIPIYMDPNQVRQMILNLLTNAYRYTNEGGQVTVEATQTSSEVVFLVKDTGIGISDEDQVNIFERFYRVDKSRDRDTGGMGVGLTIVKKLVEMYDGTITVESMIGVGSTFKISLPKGKVL